MKKIISICCLIIGISLNVFCDDYYSGEIRIWNTDNLTKLARDYITVSHSALDAESIEIYNIYGESVTTTPPSGHPFELEGEKIRIDISNLTPGVYFVRIGDKFEKFIKI